MSHCSVVKNNSMNLVVTWRRLTPKIIYYYFIVSCGFMFNNCQSSSRLLYMRLHDMSPITWFEFSWDMVKNTKTCQMPPTVAVSVAIFIFSKKLFKKVFSLFVFTTNSGVCCSRPDCDWHRDDYPTGCFIPFLFLMH